MCLCLSCSLLPQGLCTCCSLYMESSPLFTWLTTTHSSTFVQASLTSPTISVLPVKTLVLFCKSFIQSIDNSQNVPLACAIVVKSFLSQWTLQHRKDYFCLSSQFLALRRCLINILKPMLRYHIWAIVPGCKHIHSMKNKLTSHAWC